MAFHVIQCMPMYVGAYTAKRYFLWQSRQAVLNAQLTGPTGASNSQLDTETAAADAIAALGKSHIRRSEEFYVRQGLSRCTHITCVEVYVILKLLLPSLPPTIVESACQSAKHASNEGCHWRCAFGLHGSSAFFCQQMLSRTCNAALLAANCFAVMLYLNAIPCGVM